MNHCFVDDECHKEDKSILQYALQPVQMKGIRMLSVSFHKYGDVCGERDGVEFATKKLMPSRRHPSG